MAGNVSEVDHVKKYALTWYQRIILSATVQKMTNGTNSSGGKNDYGCGEIIENHKQTLVLSREEPCMCQVENVAVRDIEA